MHDFPGFPDSKTARTLRRCIRVAAASGVALCGAWASQARASETATATITQPTSAVVGGKTRYTYNLSLTNTSTDGSTVGTFWFAWIPHQSYLQSNPISVAAPSGWANGPDSQPVNGPFGEKGASIEWQANGSPTFLGAGKTLSGFSFTTPDAPSSVFGNSVYFPGTPVLTSTVYSAGPFSDGGNQFIVQVIPEPATLGLFAIGTLGLLALRSRRRQAV